ncbi:TPA: fimbrial protein [Salmonella enterica subsp. enterica serovar Bahrenfeld]|nr:fimbrial protein [Salmonella enterica]HAR9009560.1 fimbrial protein [Salmonella enterica]HAR9319063.1 fimbrial protein [Salmonella enterica]
MLSRKLHFNILLVLGLALVFINNTYASCFSSGSITPTGLPSAIKVQRDAAVGSLIWSGEVMQLSYTCDTNKLNTAYLWYWSHKNISGNMMNTNLSGLGYKVKITEQSNNFNPSPISAYVNTYGGWWNYSGTVVQKANVTVEFYKTQPTVQSGTLNGEMFYTGYTSVAPYPYDMDVINFTPLIVTTVACSITTPSLTFPIGNVLASNFGTSVGTIPANGQVTQNLGLNCDAGENINVALQGIRNPDVSTTSVLALTGQGNADVAGGVGVQLLYNGSPLILNNSIVLKQSTGGQETFPITARYYQTKTSVSTGKANASATLNITYQ